MKVPVCGSGVWLSHQCGLTIVGSFDLLGRSTSDTSPVAQIIEIGAGYRVVDVRQPNNLIPLGLLMNTPPLKNQCYLCEKLMAKATHPHKESNS